MDKRILGEFMGTAVLILMGNGVVANVSLKKTYAENSGWMVITTGWMLAVMCGVFTAVAFGSADAHLNPAVTLGFAVNSGDFSMVLPFAAAQIAGALVGATLVWLHYLPHWSQTPEPAAKRGCFCTSPAIRGLGVNLLSEVIGTFLLVLLAGVIFSKTVVSPSPGLGPYLIGSVVWGIGLSLGGTTGYAINPARDLGPRIAHAILPIAKKADSGWDYALVPIVGPLAGGALAGLVIRLAHL